MDDLKDCPFCGSDEVELRQNPRNDYYIKCWVCEMMTNYYHESSKGWLVVTWNTRK